MDNKCRIRFIIGITCLLTSIYMCLYGIAQTEILLGIDFTLFVLGWFMIINSVMQTLSSDKTDFSRMFSGYTNHSSHNLGDKFDTSKVTDFTNMFSGCSDLSSINLKEYHTYASKGHSDNFTHVSNTCQHCKIKTEEDVCPQCGHIIDMQKIEHIPLAASKNITPNVFLVILVNIFLILSFAGTITEFITTTNFGRLIPFFIFDIFFLTLSVFIYVRPCILLRSNKTVLYKGTVYGYADEDCESDKAVNEQHCYILCDTPEGVKKVVTSYNLGNKQIYKVDDRPYALKQNLSVYVNGKYFIIR